MAALPTPGGSDVWGATLNAAIKSVTTQGLAASRPASGDFEGQVYSATDTGEVWRWDGSAWTIWALALPEGTTDGDVPVWDATAGLWVPGTGGGGSTGDAAWITPTFTNSWVDYGDAQFAPTRYRKDGQGIVHIRGLIKNGVMGSAAFTLPVGYRPIASLLITVCVSNSTPGRLDIQGNGQVIPTTGVNGFMSVNAHFYADQ